MKFIKGKLLQKANGKKRGKYLLTIELTDYDIDMFEEFGVYATRIVYSYNNPEVSKIVPDEKWNRYLSNCFHNVFGKLWGKFD